MTSINEKKMKKFLVKNGVIRDFINIEIKHGTSNVLKLYSKMKTIEGDPATPFCARRLLAPAGFARRGDNFDPNCTSELTKYLHPKRDLLNLKKERVINGGNIRDRFFAFSKRPLAF